MWPFNQIAADWPILRPMLTAAPTTVTLTTLALLAIGFGLSSWLGRREKNALKEQIATIKAQKDLAEQINREEKERSKRLAEELTNLKKPHVPPTFNQVANSSTQVIATLFEIEEKKTMRFTGAPESWAPDQLNKFAQFALLRDAQAVKIEFHGSAPQHTVVTSTNTASEITGYINSLKNPYK